MAGAPAPYVPTVTHELDTQNFEEFEEKEAASGSASNRRRLRADPNFIGYTYKNWEAVSPRQGVPFSSLAAPSLRHSSEMLMSGSEASFMGYTMCLVGRMVSMLALSDIASKYRSLPYLHRLQACQPMARSALVLSGTSQHLAIA